jgi:hypothetical protein
MNRGVYVQLLWKVSRYNTLCPNTMAIARNGLSIFDFISSLVVALPTKKQRADMISHWIRVMSVWQPPTESISYALRMFSHVRIWPMLAESPTDVDGDIGFLDDPRHLRSTRRVCGSSIATVVAVSRCRTHEGARLH